MCGFPRLAIFFTLCAPPCVYLLEALLRGFEVSLLDSVRLLFEAVEDMYFALDAL